MQKNEQVDIYIASFSLVHQQLLLQIRQIIMAAAPKATEVISYGMPAYKGNKVLVYFASAKQHIGFYPTPSAIKKFEKELAKFNYSKGAVQLPLDKPLPKTLITKMVKYRVKEDGGSRE
jgi:uncharacterized protein YdhG (YjbR/CyaY superfamily)